MIYFKVYEIERYNFGKSVRLWRPPINTQHFFSVPIIPHLYIEGKKRLITKKILSNTFEENNSHILCKLSIKTVNCYGISKCTNFFKSLIFFDTRYYYSLINLDSHCNVKIVDLKLPGQKRFYILFLLNYNYYYLMCKLIIYQFDVLVINVIFSSGINSILQ